MGFRAEEIPGGHLMQPSVDRATGLKNSIADESASLITIRLFLPKAFSASYGIHSYCPRH